MFLVFILIFTLLFSRPILASDNIFGLHLTQPQDINSAHLVINSSNGDWGWTTIVIRTDQLDRQTWQDFFDNCRKYHIIPIIRLSTKSEGENWKQPDELDINNLANFLNSLNWPSQEKHIVLFNEINHASEWGGELNIKKYVDISIYAFKKFKELDPNFIILSSGLDLAAPDNRPQFMSAENVYKEIYEYKPEYFNNIDGITSHSYPNHGFVGLPSDTGQHSVVGYKWELDFIKKLGISKDFPIYITETGWPHREGEDKKNSFYTTNTTANFLKMTLNMWAQDKNVKAVTPFIYNYPNEPFDHFSWLDKDEKMYPEYQQLIDMPKNKNNPVQTTKYEITKMYLPFIIFNDTQQEAYIILKNTGQSIWGETNFCLNSNSTPNLTVDSLCTDDKKVFPNQERTFKFKFKINKSANFQGKTLIGWESLPSFEIAPFDKNATIYHPKLNFLDRTVGFWKKLFSGKIPL
jgi:hypothetical protein